MDHKASVPMQATRFLFTLLLALGAGDIFAQQSAWPANWLFFPPGRAEKVYTLVDPAAPASRVLEVVTNKAVGSGSLLINVDTPLTDQTTLRWRWNARRLPSAVAEDTEPTHNYFAIAVMFDNDQVLSYMWSATLPVGTVFQCPQPRWKDRETHLVMYSGEGQLGRWLNEERQLLADYSRLKQGALPKAIKQVWFIAGVNPEGHSAAVSFSDVSLGDRPVDRTRIFSQRGLSQLDRQLAAVNATLPGRWSGFSEAEDLATGRLVRSTMALSYTTISKDKLDYGYWGPRGFTFARYQGDGKYQLQHWPFAGEPSTIEYQVTAVTPPDAAGSWSVDELVSMPDAKGGLQQWRQQWSLKGSELRVEREKPPSGAPAATPWVRGHRVTKVKDD